MKSYLERLDMRTCSCQSCFDPALIAFYEAVDEEVMMRRKKLLTQIAVVVVVPVVSPLVVVLVIFMIRNLLENS